MKNVKFSLLVLLLMVGIGVNAQNGEKGYTIQGVLSDAPDGLKVRLKEVKDDFLSTIFQSEVMDSTIVKNGKFEFKGILDQAKMVTIVFEKEKKKEQSHAPVYQPVVPLFLENTSIEVSAKLEELPDERSLFTEGGYDYKQVEIKGSKSHQLYMSYLNGVKGYAEKGDKLFMGEYVSYLNPGKDKEKGPISKGVEIVTKIDENKEARKAFVFNFIKQHSSTAVSLFIANNEISKLSVSELENLLSSIPKDMEETVLGQRVVNKAQEMKQVAPGAKVVNLPFKDIEGNAMELSDYVGKGKYVLLEFWASWCGPCRADIPHLKEVYELYHPEGFEVISISMDEDHEKWIKAVEEEKMSWLQVSDGEAFKGDLSKIYKIRGIPTCVLIDPDGKIVTRNMRGSFMDKRLIEMYGNKFGSKF